jgi:predicted ATP-dependent endonuclease of OLD family
LKKESLERGKQIFVATHSMVFIHRSSLNEVSIILTQNRNDISISLLEDLVPPEERNTFEGINIMRDHIYQALGYEPRFSFETEKIILVEGKTDKAVLTVFSKN